MLHLNFGLLLPYAVYLKLPCCTPQVTLSPACKHQVCSRIQVPQCCVKAKGATCVMNTIYTLHDAWQVLCWASPVCRLCH